MGFFGVAAAIGDESVPSVRRCHLNIWTLGGLLGYRVSCFDVGLHLRADQGPIGALRIGLPVSTPSSPDSALESLKTRMENPTVASLIFARENATRDGSVALDEGMVPLLDIDRPHCEMAEKPRGKHFSLWTLRLVDPVPEGQSGYLRVRFHVQRPGRLWIWQRSLLARNRAIVDCRVNDEREAQSVVDISEFTRHLLPLEALNAFVIAPAIFTHPVITPEPEYVRGLEGSIWEGYLGRRTDLRREQKFLIYHWRNEEDTTAEYPFRAFLQLERRRSLLPSWSDLMPVLIALVLAAIFFDVQLRNLDWAGDALDFLTSGFPLAPGLGGLIVFVLLLLAARDRLREAVAALRGIGGRVDRFVYSLRTNGA